MMILAALLATGVTAAPVAPPAPVAAQSPEAVADPRPSRAEVLAAVKAEWPRYDTTGRGKLTPLEFSTWVMRAHGGVVAPRAHAAGIAPVSAMNATATAFARADADHDGGVTPEEMTRFLMLPPPPAVVAKPRSAATASTARAASKP